MVPGLNDIAFPHLHSYGRTPLSPGSSLVLPSSFTQHDAVLRQGGRLPQAAPNPAVPLSGRPRWPLQESVGWAAVFGSDPDSWAPSVGHQLPWTPDPVQALRRVTVLPGTSGACSSVVAAPSGEAAWRPVRAA